VLAGGSDLLINYGYLSSVISILRAVDFLRLYFIFHHMSDTAVPTVTVTETLISVAIRNLCLQLRSSNDQLFFVIFHRMSAPLYTWLFHSFPQMVAAPKLNPSRCTEGLKENTGR
jgi:hypothetical protein